MRGIDEIGSSGKANTEVSSAAGTTLVDAGLVVIDRMRRTTGSGVPERGEAFRLGEQRFLAAGDLAASAQPQDWTGPAAETYARANQHHIRHLTAIAALDRAVHAVLARQADQVIRHRSEIDEEADRLAQLSRASRDLDSAHGVGAAMKATVEMAAVNSALDACTHSLSRLSQLAAENNDELRGIAGEYDDLAAGADDVDAEPFGPATAATAPTSMPAGPAPSEDNAGMPTETVSALTSALGAAGGMIGTTIAPLAAALTGAAGAAVQALSALPTSGAEAAPDLAGRERADVDTDETDTDEDREDDDDPADEPADAAPEDASAQPAPLLPPAVPSPAEPPPAPIRPPRWPR